MTIQLDQDRAEAFAGQVVADTGAAFGVLLAYLGDRLGLWRALAEAGPTTATELAERTATHSRMVREWLSCQAAGGYLDYHPNDGTFSLAGEHAFGIANPTAPFDLAALWQIFVACSRDVDLALEAFRAGKGLGWADHHDELFHAIERGFAPLYRSSLTTEWIPSVPGLEERLQTGAFVADVGCGHGVSTFVMAAAYPASTFTGFDNHEPSIERARARAQSEDHGGRIRFEVASATSFPGDGYDLVCFFDCLHDMGDPLGAARRARQLIASDGIVLLVEPVAGDRLEDNLHALGRFAYGVSTLGCVPCSLAEDGPALGAQAGEARLRAVLTEAGFTQFRRVAETPLSAVYEARP